MHSYSTKIVEVMSAKPKPEGMSDVDWTARKNLVTWDKDYAQQLLEKIVKQK